MLEFNEPPVIPTPGGNQLELPNVQLPGSGYQPRPTAIDIYNKVVGNPLTGSNPGANISPNISLDEEIKQTQNFNKTLSDFTVNNLKQDYSQIMRPFTYNGDTDGAKFERYYNSAPFRELGFNPYRDNESLYNNNMTVGDEFVRAAGQWPSLIGTGIKSGIRTWGTIFTDPLAPDEKSSKEMARAMVLGSATKPGAASFFINTALNAGYTLGIGVEMLGETLALAGATAVTGGLDIEATLPTWLTRMTGSANKVKQGYETMEAFNAAKSVEGLKSFWETNRVGKVLSTVGKTINPLENTFEVGKDIAAGTNAAKFTNEATGVVNKFAQYSKNFGEFAKDMIQIKAAVSEASLEGGSVKIDVTNDLIQQYKNKYGKDPEGPELSKIEKIATEEAHRTALWNFPAISWSNKFMYETLFAPFEKSAKKGIAALSEDILFNKAEGFVKVEEGLAGEVQKLKAGIKSPEAWGKFGYNYLKQNAAEGVQENIQEAISSGAKEHALATYNNPDRASYEGYMGHFMNGVKQQFSAAGAETFAGGFIMGAIAHPFMSAPMFIGESIWNNTVNKEKHQEYQRQRGEQLDSTVKTLNELYKDPMTYLAPDLPNAIKQGSLQKEFNNANETGDRKKAEDVKNVSLFEHLYTALSSGKLDVILDKLNTFKTFTPEQASEAFNVKDGTKALGLIDDVIKRAHTIKDIHENVASAYPNPFTPSNYNKDSDEYKTQSYGYAAWEDAKKNLVFSKNEFENHSARIKKIAETLIGKRNPIKNANAQDLLTLLDRNQLQKTIISLKQDIKVTDSTTKEGKSIISDKETRIQLLTDLSDSFELTTGLMLESAQKANLNKSRQAFKKYINHIAKTSDDFVFDENLDHALDLIRDNYTLRDERASLVKSINVLNNPKGFIAIQRNLQKTYSEINNSKAEEVSKRNKMFADYAEQNKANNELLKLAGVYLTQSYSMYVESAKKNNMVIALPNSYVDATDPNLRLITDVNDPKFIKAKSVWTNIIKSIQAEYPVKDEADTKESLERIKNEKLAKITINILTLNPNDALFDEKGKQYILVQKGTTLEDTLVGEPPFGEEISASEVGRAYSADPTPILNEYNEKLAKIKKEEPIKGGKIIYATSGSGKSTYIDSEENAEGKYIDVDNLLINEIIKSAPEFKILPEATPQETLFQFASLVPKELRTKVYNNVREQMNDLKNKGHVLLTGSVDFIKDADIAYVQQDDDKVRGSFVRKNEADALLKANKTGVPLSGYIGGKLGIKTTNEPTNILTKETELKNKIKDLEDNLNKIKTNSLGFSSKLTPGDIRYTEEGDKVEFVKSNRDKYARGSEVFLINDKNNLSVDYRQRPTSGWSDQRELPFEARYKENPVSLLVEISKLKDELTALESKPTEVISDIEAKKADIERRRQELTTFSKDRKFIKGIAHEIQIQKKFGQEGFDVDVSNKADTSTGFLYSNVLSEHFDTIEEAIEYANQIIQGDKEYIKKVDAELAALKEKPKEQIIKRNYEKLSITANTNIVSNTDKPGIVKGTNIKKVGDTNDYLVYKSKQGIYKFVSYSLPNISIAESSISEEDAIEKAYDIIDEEEAKVDKKYEPINIEEQLKNINESNTFNDLDNVYDNLSKSMILESTENNELVNNAYDARRNELMTNKELFTVENLKQAKKRGYKLIVNGKIYPIFTVNKSGKISLLSPLQTKAESAKISDIQEITTAPMEKPEEVSSETTDQIKEIIKTGEDIVSSEDLNKTNEDAKTQNNKDINNDFFNNLGCK